MEREKEHTWKWNSQQHQSNSKGINDDKKYYQGERKEDHACLNVRRSNTLAWRKLEEVGYTIFVDHFPDSMTRSWLWQLFGHARKVVDVLISRKKRKTSSAPFAFVRFATRKEVEQAIYD